MNLDDYQRFSAFDPNDMHGHIFGLPEQLQKAWELGQTLSLPTMQPVKRVVIAGMGGSAIGADLLASCLLDRTSVSVMVQRDYGLPAFAKGEETLVVVSSHSGNTEESLSVFEDARKNECQVVAITTGGELLKRSQAVGIPACVFDHHGQPRAAVGYSFGLLLALFVKLGLVADLSVEI